MEQSSASVLAVVTTELESISDGMTTHEYAYEYDNLHSFFREERDGVMIRLLRAAKGKQKKNTGVVVAKTGL